MARERGEVSGVGATEVAADVAAEVAALVEIEGAPSDAAELPGAKEADKDACCGDVTELPGSDRCPPLAAAGVGTVDGTEADKGVATMAGAGCDGIIMCRGEDADEAPGDADDDADEDPCCEYAGECGSIGNDDSDVEEDDGCGGRGSDVACDCTCATAGTGGKVCTACCCTGGGGCCCCGCCIHASSPPPSPSPMSGTSLK